MACERPRKIVNRRYRDMPRRMIYEYSQLVYGTFWPPDYYIDVPCGYCHSCKKREMNDYKVRLLYECRKPLDSGRVNLFVTLTFDDENLEKFAGDTNRAVRLFLDRMRKRYGRQVRHWFIGEYGSLKGRPHYHGIIFGAPLEISRSPYGSHPGQNLELENVWSYGFVFVGYVTDSTVGYITKYLTKDLNGDKVRPRVISSKGIGDNYLDSDDAKLHHLNGYQPYLSLGSFTYALPRYYSNKLFSDVDRQNMALDRYLNPSDTWRWQGRKYLSVFDFRTARLATLDQHTRDGLTSVRKPPTRKTRSSLVRFKENLERFEKEFNNAWL